MPDPTVPEVPVQQAAPAVDYDALASKFGATDYAEPKPVDYDALASQFGGTDYAPKQQKPVDYDALASKFGGTDYVEAPATASVLPGMPAPPVPYGLQTPQQHAADAVATGAIYRNPRTGRVSPQMPPGEEGGPLGFLDSAPLNIIHGTEALAHPVEAAIKEAGRSEVRGTQVPAGPTNIYPGMGRDVARGTTDIAKGVLEASTPAIGEGLVTAPIRGALALGAGFGSQYAAQKILQQSGIAPEYTDLGSTLAGLAVGGTIAGWNKFFDLVDAHNAQAEAVFAQERAAGQATAQAAGIANVVVPPEGIPVTIDGAAHTVKPLDINFAPESVPSTRKPVYGVYDEQGNLVNAGTGPQVSEFLGKSDAVPANAPPQTHADLDARYAEMTAERAEAQSDVDRRNFLQNASPEGLLAERERLQGIVDEQNKNIYGRQLEGGGYQFAQEEVTSPERVELKLIDDHLATGKPIPPDLPAEEVLKDTSEKLGDVQKQRTKLATEAAKPPAPPPEPPKPVPVQKVSPATPAAPTSAQPTTPESPETIALQIQQMGSFGDPVRQDQRKVVWFSKGQGQPINAPPGVALGNDGLGNTFFYRPDLIKKSAIRTASHNNTLPELLGGPLGMGAPDKTALQGPPVAVTGTAPDGTEAQTTVTDAGNLPQTIAATHAVTPQGGTVEVKTPETALQDRRWAQAKLPPQLAGAKPRYAFGPKQFELAFASDLDRAAYITGQTNLSKADAAYLQFAMQTTGLSEDAIRQYGRDIRQNVIKELARTAPGGTTLTIPAQSSKLHEPAALTKMGGDLAQGIVDNMYGMLWDKVQAGEVNESGQPSALLQGAKIIRSRGGLQTPEEFKAYAHDYARVPRDENFQSAMQVLVKKYYPPLKEVVPNLPVTPRVNVWAAAHPVLAGPETSVMDLARMRKAASIEAFGKEFGDLSPAQQTAVDGDLEREAQTKRAKKIAGAPTGTAVGPRIPKIEDMSLLDIEKQLGSDARGSEWLRRIQQVGPEESPERTAIEEDNKAAGNWMNYGEAGSYPVLMNRVYSALEKMRNGAPLGDQERGAVSHYTGTPNPTPEQLVKILKEMLGHEADAIGPSATTALHKLYAGQTELTGEEHDALQALAGGKIKSKSNQPLKPVTAAPRVTPQVPTGVAGSTPLGISREPWEMRRDDYVGDGNIPGSSLSRLTARELANRAKELDITGYDTKTVSGRNQLARAIAHKSMVTNAIKRGDIIPPDVLSDYPELQPARARTTSWENSAAPSWWKTAFGTENIQEPWEMVRDSYVNRIKTDPGFSQTMMDYAGDWADNKAEAGFDRRAVGKLTNTYNATNNTPNPLPGEHAAANNEVAGNVPSVPTGGRENAPSELPGEVHGEPHAGELEPNVGGVGEGIRGVGAESNFETHYETDALEAELRKYDDDIRDIEYALKHDELAGEDRYSAEGRLEDLKYHYDDILEPLKKLNPELADDIDARVKGRVYFLRDDSPDDSIKTVTGERNVPEFKDWNDFRDHVKEGDTVYYDADRTHQFSGTVRDFLGPERKVIVSLNNNDLPENAPIRQITDRGIGHISTTMPWEIVRTKPTITREGHLTPEHALPAPIAPVDVNALQPDGVRRVTGSSDLPLIPSGVIQAADLAKKAVKHFDMIIHAPNQRSTQTAAAFPGPKGTFKSLSAWPQGAREGQPSHSVQEDTKRLMMNPDATPYGVSPISGLPGKTWNEMAQPMFRDVMTVENEIRPNERILFLTSGGNLQAIDAWSRAGSPADGQFDHAEMANKPYWSVTGKMFKRTPNGLEEVKNNEEAGIPYFAEHAETAYNAKPGHAPEGVENNAAPATTPVQRPGQENPRPLEAGEAEVPAEITATGEPATSGGGGGGGARQPVHAGAPGGASGRPGGRNSPGAVEPTGRTPGGRSTGDLVKQTEGGDFRISPTDHIGQGTLRTKLNDNLEAIRTIKKIESEGRPATAEEQEKLAKYVGWGAMSQIFDWNNREWAGARAELVNLLTPEEYKAASASTKNAHFTSPMAITSMWDAMQRFGLQADSRVLEPSMGIGSFFGLQPDFLMPSKRTGVELDKITGAMAKALYPDSNVQVTGFEKMSLPKDFFDIAIGNVPFGNYGVYDPQYKRNPTAVSSIHNYFFVKSLDLVRPGGVVAYITSRFTMDAQDPALRAMLASKANLLGMMRLPNKAFKENAGTSVVTDMIFLQKRAPGEAQSGPAFLNLTGIDTEDGPTRINEYYAAHPEMMLGKLTMKGSMYGAEPSQDLEGSLTPEILQEAVGRLPQNVYSEWAAETPAFNHEGNDYVQLGDRVKDGGYDIKNGVIVQREGSIFKPAAVNDKTGPRIRAMIPVRGALYDVLETQLSNAPEEKIVAARNELNRAYDAFVKAHGAINDPANARALGDDPDYVPMSGALENYDRKTKQAKKTEIFTQKTVERPTFPDHADTAPEALAMTLNQLGRLDWARMQELTGKTPDELLEELGNQVFQNPDGQKWETQDEYLSGNVRKKLDMAEEAAKIEPAYRRNIEALKAVQPIDLRPDEIKVTPGAPWIPAGTVQDFVRQILNLQSAVVHYSADAATWSIDVGKVSKNTVANKETWGASKYLGHQLFDIALNGKMPRVYQPGPNDTRIFDPEATAVAQAGMDALKDKFREWIWEDPQRATMLAAKYNKEVNNLRGTDHDGSFLTLPGHNPAIILRPHQLNAIWRTLKVGNTLLAHEMGAGKTYVMVSIAMESRRLGLAKKPMIAVPNHMAEQFSKEFLQLYPAARILTIGRDDFAKENRTRAVARIASGNWDAVIIRHSSYGKIPVSDATYQAFVDDQVAELKAALADQLVATGYRPGKDGKEGKKDKTVKEIEKAISRLEVKLQKHLNREDKDTGLTFEQLGVDMLMVDEADAFKALPIVTRRTRVAGIPTSESDRATDMYMKTQYLTALNGGTRGVVFATGTPVTNTMAELYNMQRYLQGKALADGGIKHFDAWANQHGDVRTGIELDVSGKGFRENTRFAKFINIPELMKMYMQVADIKTADMLKLPRPDLETGGYIAIAGASSPELEAYIDHLIDRSEEIRSGNVDKSVDNMLKVVSEGKKAALDMRLVDPQASDRPTSKVNRAVANIARIHHTSAESRSTQLVFCDLSVPLSVKRGKKNKAAVPPDVDAEDDLTAVPEGAGELAGFSVYDDMRRKLINAGVKPDEIAFIHDYDTDEKKQDLFDDINNGHVRIVFASTQKMGVGTNVQKRMLALHNLDAPWRPADIMQRVARMQRQGNMHKTVQVYQYLTEGSFDAYSWQLLENKAAFIAPILAGDITIREMEDVGMMLPSAAEFKAMASGNPIIKEKIGTDSQLAKLAVQRAAFQRQQLGIKHEMANLPDRIKNLEHSAEQQESQAKFIENHKEDGFQIFPTANSKGGKFTGEGSRQEAADALHGALLDATDNIQEQSLGTYKGLYLRSSPKMYDPNSEFAKTEDGRKARYPGIKIIGPYSEHYVTVNQDQPISTIRSIEAITRGMGEVSEWTLKDLDEAKTKLNQLAPLLDRTWPHEKAYADLAKRKAQIDAQLDQSEAEKAAGSEDGDTVKQIPKGTSYRERKHILLARERGEQVEYSSPAETTTLPPTAKANPVSTVKPTKDSGPMQFYRPTNEDIPPPDNGWYVQTVDGKPYHSDGRFLLQGEPPEGAVSPNQVDMKKFLDVPDGSEEITPKAYWTETSPRGVKTNTIGFSADTAIPSDNYDYVKKRFPDAAFFTNPNDKRQVFVKSGGNLVGLVMGMREPNPPGRLRDVLAPPVPVAHRPRVRLIDDSHLNDNSTEREVLSAADAKYERPDRQMAVGHGHIYLNQIGADIAARIMDAAKLKVVAFDGITLTGWQTAQLKNYLADIRKSDPFAAKLLVEINRAQADSQITTFIRSGPGISIGETQAARREEAFHRAQRTTPTGIPYNVGPIVGETLAKDSEVEKAMAGVRRERFTGSPDQEWEELGAVLASGQGYQIGLDQTQSAALLKKYIDALIETNGPRAGTVLKMVIPQMRKALGDEYVKRRWNGRYRPSAEIAEKPYRPVGENGPSLRPQSSSASGTPVRITDSAGQSQEEIQGLRGGAEAANQRATGGGEVNGPRGLSTSGRSRNPGSSAAGEIESQPGRVSGDANKQENKAGEVNGIKTTEERERDVEGAGPSLRPRESSAARASQGGPNTERELRERAGAGSINPRSEPATRENAFNATQNASGENPENVQGGSGKNIGQDAAVGATSRGASAPRLTPESGQAPALMDLLGAIAKRTGLTPDPNAPVEGKRHYSQTSAAARIFLPGRQLAEIKEASRKVYNELVRAGAASSQASAIMHNAMPQIRKALDGTGIDIHELFSAYQESRLRGIKERYQDWANDVIHMDDEQTKDAVYVTFPNGQSTLLEMLDKLDDKLEALDLSQSAAVLIENENWPTLRALAFGAFDEAADSVVDTMDDARYQKIKDEAAHNPKVAEADRLYGDLVEAEVAEAHARHDGIFATELGDLGRYFPLMAGGKNQNKLSSGRRLMARVPKNMNNQMAMGMSSEGYTTDLGELSTKIGSSLRASGKANALNTIARTGWSRPEPKNWDKIFVGPDGIAYQGVKLESKASRTVIVNGKVVHTATSNIILPRFLYEGMKPILGAEPSSPEDVLKVVRWLNLVSTKFLPAELAYHSNGMFGAMYGNTPFISGDTAMKKILTAPILKWFYIRHQMVVPPLVNAVAGKQVMKDPLDPSTPENAQKLIRIAKIGALPARSHTITYSKKIAEETGAKQEPWYTWGPMLYGPRGFDARSRIFLYDMATGTDPDMPDDELADFINQLANYTPEFQGTIEKFLKYTQVGPFATAGMTRVVNGFHALTGTGPTPNRKKGGQRAWQIMDKLLWGTVAAAAIYALGYKALTGKMPWHDPRFKFGSIPLGGDNHGWIDQFRHTGLGNLQWGDGPEVGYINVGSVIAPLIERVAPKTAINRLFHHGSAGQVGRGVGVDFFNTIAHPAMGPVARSLFTGVTGSEPYMTDLAVPQHPMDFFPAYQEKNLKRGFLGGFAPHRASGNATGHPGDAARLGAHFAAALRELSSTLSLFGEESGAVGQDEQKGSLAFRTAMGLAMPEFLGTASNPYSSENYLMKQKRELAEMSLPEALKVYDAATPAERQQIYRPVRDKVYAAKNNPARWDDNAKSLARFYFNVTPRVPAMLGIGSPSPIQ